MCVISTSSTKVSLDCIRLYWSPFILSQKSLIVPITQNTFNEVLIYIIFVIWLGTFVYIISVNLLKNIERGVSVPFSYQEINVSKDWYYQGHTVRNVRAWVQNFSVHLRCKFLFTFIMSAKIELMYVDALDLTNIHQQFNFKGLTLQFWPYLKF